MESENKFICNNLYKYIIDELANCIDNEIFSNVTIEGLGEFYYKKALAQVDGATDELLQFGLWFIKKQRLKI